MNPICLTGNTRVSDSDSAAGCQVLEVKSSFVRQYKQAKFKKTKQNWLGLERLERCWGL